MLASCIVTRASTNVYKRISCSIDLFESLCCDRFIYIYTYTWYKINCTVGRRWSALNATTPGNSTENIPPARRTESASRHARLRAANVRKRAKSRMPKRCCCSTAGFLTWVQVFSGGGAMWCRSSRIHHARTHARTQYEQIIPPSRLHSRPRKYRNRCTLQHSICIAGFLLMCF